MQLLCMDLVGTFVEPNIVLAGKVHNILLGLGADDLAAGLGWEVYNEGGHGWRCALIEELMFAVETGENYDQS